MKKLRKRIKAVLIVTTIVLTSLFTDAARMIITKAASSSTLNTGYALGSPVLNKKFSTENWDKWEMVTFGIYLSNFCVPLVDSYESAFSTSSTYGSKGNGVRALEMGSGNGPENNKVIEELLTSAIEYQYKEGAIDLYVSFSKFTFGKVESKTDPNNGGAVRKATFQDLFLSMIEPETDAENQSWAYNGTSSKSDHTYESILIPVTDDYLIDSTGYGYLPTFYVYDGSKYIQVLDYTNAWDLQCMSNILYVGDTSELSDEFFNTYSDMYNSNTSIYLDSFGNFIANHNGVNKVIFPAAANRNLTVNGDINLLNSWIFNGYTGSITEDIVSSGAQWYPNDDVWYSNLIPETLRTTQYFDTTSLGTLLDGQKWYGGSPAFGAKRDGEKLKDGTVLLYYDTDSILMSEWQKLGDPSGVIDKPIGDIILELFSQSINNSNYTLKLETTDFDRQSFEKDTTEDGALNNTLLSAVTLSNTLGTTVKIENSEIMKPDGSSVEMLGKQVIVANQLKVGSDTSDVNITRQLINYMYQVYQGDVKDTKYGKLKKEDIVDWLQGCEEGEDFNSVLLQVYNYFKASYPKYKNVNYDPSGSFINDSDNISKMTRFTSVIMPSETLDGCAEALGIKDGAEFSTFCTYIYATYLNFYGINSGSKLGVDGGNTTTLNTEIFKSSKALDYDINNSNAVISKQQKEEEVLNMSYLILSDSEAGEKYRNALSLSNIESFISTQYNKIVYGADGSTAETGGYNGGGYLNIDTLDTNQFTSVILDIYGNAAVVVIVIALILIIVMGLLNRKGIAWFLVSIFLSVNLVLLIPTVCNVGPSLSNYAVQGIMSSKMTNWAVNEQIEYENISSDYADMDDEGLEVAQLVSRLSMLNADRTLMLKQDISSKVTEKLGETYSGIQNLTTARWILPVLMQQIDAGGSDTAKYVYVSLTNKMDDASNIFLYYKDDYADSVGTLAASSGSGGNTGESISSSERTSKYYTGYIDTSRSSEYNGNKYRHIGYYDSDYDEMTHTYFYLLQADGATATPLCKSKDIGKVDLSDIESWQSYIDNTVGKDTVQWESTLSHIENVCDEYDRFDRGTIDKSYGYLWNTETLLPYMYCTVQDSFSATESLGSLIGKLQGTYEETSNGEKVRSSFMFGTSASGESTGYVCDILDLQELLTNNIPYTYQMWLSAGGFDGVSGIFADKEVENTDYYDGNKASWLFRSNWAIKIMENEDLNGSDTIRDKDGNKYTVENMLYPECYPDNRPMVFSEAQQKAYGLSDSDLSYVELKCVSVNKEVSKKWTSLINYAGTANLSKEVLVRQMAIDATMEFNKEFTTNIVNTYKTELYPYSLDLRSLSFDSVMRMILLNVSNDSSYTYGTTVDSVIRNTDVFTSGLLLICAVFCTYVIPLIRNIIVTLIFVLCIVALITSFNSSAKYKSKVVGGTAISEVLFGVTSIAYYFGVKLLMSISSADEVLNIEVVKSSIKNGSPFVAILVLTIWSGVYIFIMFKSIKFFWQNRRDMGFDTYVSVGVAVREKMSNFAQSVKSRLSGSSSESESSGGRGKLTDMFNRHRGYDEDTDERYRKEDTDRMEETEDSGYDSYTSDEEYETNEERAEDIAEEIDAEIDKEKETEGSEEQ